MFTLDDEDKEELGSLTDKDKSEVEDQRITELTHKAIRRKFEYPEYALFEEFTGSNGRRLDALALNLYKSRGFEIIGFEVKASRQDWKKELNNSAKNDYFVRKCDKFYVVAGRKGIVEKDELPKGWGLYEMKGGGRLYNIKKSNLSEFQAENVDEELYWRMVKKAIKKHKQKIRDLNWQKKRKYKEGKKEGMKMSDASEEVMKKAERMERLEEHNIYARSDRSVEKLALAKEVADYVDEEGISSLNRVVGQMRGKIDFMEKNLDQFEDKVEDLNEMVQED